MTRLITLICLLYLFLSHLLLSGCAIQSDKSQHQARPTPIQPLLSQNRFIEAEKIIAKNLESHNNTRYWLAQAVSVANMKYDYAEKSLKRIKNAWKKGKLHESVQRLEQLKTQVGALPELVTLHQSYRSKLNNDLANIRYLKVLLDSDHLADKIDLHKKMKALVSQEAFLNEQIQLEAQKQELHQILFAEAQRLLNNKQKKLALKILQAGKRLNDRRSIAMLHAIESKHQQAVKKAKRQQIEQQRLKEENEVLKLIALFRSSVRHKDIASAKEALSHLKSSQHAMPNKTAKLEEELTLIIDRRIKELYALGKDFYSLGSYQAALETWSAILELSPEHPEVNLLKSRTLRVLKNLQKLSDPAITAEE